MSQSKILIYLMRRDLRVSDNQILHTLSTQKDHGFTHFLPLYVFPAQQIEVKGFIPDKCQAKSPYPDARSKVASFWRCGPHRAKFTAESVWDVKEALEKVGSGLCIRVGMVGEVVQEMLRRINERNDASVGAVWMVGEETVEEKEDERDIIAACDADDVPYKIWADEKYLIDDHDIPFDDPQDLPGVFTTYRKSVEPLRERPHPVLDSPKKDSLPPFPSDSVIPVQHAPFAIPSSLDGILSALARPLTPASMISNPPSYPQGAKSAHPFLGGESTAQARLYHTIKSGSMTNYKETRNGLLGEDFSSKLSAWLALGCITARQIHDSLVEFEDGTSDHEDWKEVEGYGKGQNKGTEAMRFELLWRDFMRLCARKFGPKLFALGGFCDVGEKQWYASAPRSGVSPDISYQDMIERLLNGTTGMGLIDASQREVYLTGYTSNRARQNVASFLAKRLKIDWRIGAEWYESILVDYDVASNWGNWQYLAGVGVDPRGEARIFNPVKQASDYDPNGDYVKNWVPELRVEGLQPTEVFQSWTIDASRRKNLGLEGLIGVEKPLLAIQYTIGKKGKKSKQGSKNGKHYTNNQHSNNNNYNTNNHYNNNGPTPTSPNYNQGAYAYTPRSSNGYQRGGGGYGGRGYGSTTGHLRGRGGHSNHEYHSSSNAAWNHGVVDGSGGGGRGREARSGHMDKDRENRGDE